MSVGTRSPTIERAAAPQRGASWILAACLVLAWLSFAIGQHPLQRPSILSCESAAPTRSSSLKARYISASRHDGQTHMYGSGIQHSRSDVDYMAPACPIPSDARSSCPILRSTAGRADEVEVVDADATQVVRHIVQLTGGAHTVRSEERVVGMDATWSKGVQTQRTVWRVLKKCLVRAASGGLPGAAAGLLQVVTLMWLRTLVNYQCRYGTSLAAAASELYRQGGVMRFYRGVFFALVSNPLSRFGMAAANEGATALTELLPRQASMTFTTWVASLLAAVWRVFLTPLDTCKTVLQVEGPKGFASLMNKVWGGNVVCLYQGATAAAAATAVGYFPWFLTFNFLNKRIRRPSVKGQVPLRNAGIGLVASICSDLCSNSIRVLKTTKQAAAAYNTQVTYRGAAALIIEADGWLGLFGRGLITRILANGLQSMLFTVVWRYLHDKYIVSTDTAAER